MNHPQLRSTPHTSGRPFLVQERPAVVHRAPLLVLWHLLSLDAPTVAATWTAFLGWCFGVAVPALDLVAMFVAVWILYAVDRLLDVQPPFADPVLPELRDRHRFHHQQRGRLLPALACGTLLLAALLHRTDDRVLHLYVLLTCLLAAWLLLVHVRRAPDANPHRLPKELAVGFFFPAAAFIPAVARVPALRFALLPYAALFGAVCTLNCFFLHAWEHPVERSDAHPSTRWGATHAPYLAGGLVVAGATAACVSAGHLRAAGHDGHALPHAALFDLACTLAAALLSLLHFQRRRMAPVTLRALADLVLLTPIPLWSLRCLWR